MKIPSSGRPAGARHPWSSISGNSLPRWRSWVNRGPFAGRSRRSFRGRSPASFRASDSGRPAKWIVRRGRSAIGGSSELADPREVSNLQFPIVDTILRAGPDAVSASRSLYDLATPAETFAWRLLLYAHFIGAASLAASSD